MKSASWKVPWHATSARMAWHPPLRQSATAVSGWPGHSIVPCLLGRWKLCDNREFCKNNQLYNYTFHLYHFLRTESILTQGHWGVVLKFHDRGLGPVQTSLQRRRCSSKLTRSFQHGVWKHFWFPTYTLTAAIDEKHIRIANSRYNLLVLLSRSRLCHYSVGGAWWHLCFYKSFYCSVRMISPATGVESEGVNMTEWASEIG
jgi:hypothetical protein